MAVGDSADAEVMEIDQRYPGQLSYITVRFSGDDSGRPWEKKFTCDYAGVVRLSVGDYIRIEQIRVLGWQIDPSEHLASGFTPDFGNLRKG